MDKDVGIRERFHRTSDSFGLVFLLILTSLLLTAAAGEYALARPLNVALDAVILIAVFHASNASRRSRRAVLWVAGPVAAAGIVLAALGADQASRALWIAAALVVASVTTVVILRRIGTHPEITLKTVLGAVCVYLLIGIFFAFLYALMQQVSAPFFAQPLAKDRPLTVDFLYFSYTTQTTVGYGDFTARSDLGHMFAITQALLGQLYLVTVLALVVGNLGRERTRREGRSRDDTPREETSREETSREPGDQ